jgi:hypothetical protein
MTNAILYCLISIGFIVTLFVCLCLWHYFTSRIAGFFAKLAVLFHFNWIAIVAVIASTISAANYLSLVKSFLFNLKFSVT